MNLKKNKYIFISILLLVVISCFFYRRINSIEVESNHETFIKVNCDSINLGKIEWGNLKKEKIVIKNIGTYPLIIKDIEAECSCITFMWKKKRVLPDKKCEIILYFEASTYGEVNKSINIIANIPKGYYTLRITGEVLPPKWLKL